MPWPALAGLGAEFKERQRARCAVMNVFMLLLAYQAFAWRLVCPNTHSASSLVHPGINIELTTSIFSL